MKIQQRRSVRASDHSIGPPGTRSPQVRGNSNSQSQPNWYEVNVSSQFSANSQLASSAWIPPSVGSRPILAQCGIPGGSIGTGSKNRRRTWNFPKCGRLALRVCPASTGAPVDHGVSCFPRILQARTGATPCARMGQPREPNKFVRSVVSGSGAAAKKQRPVSGGRHASLTNRITSNCNNHVSTLDR